jgi:hypothetical protein
VTQRAHISHPQKKVQLHNLPVGDHSLRLVDALVQSFLTV